MFSGVLQASETAPSIVSGAFGATQARSYCASKYICSRCHQKFTPAQAGQHHYRDPKDGGRLVPLDYAAGTGKPVVTPLTRDDAIITYSRAHRLGAQGQRSVIDYFDLLPSLGIGGSGTRQEKQELLQADNHPIIDVRHDYLLVHPDSSPAEEIAVFRGRNNADLVADSLSDHQCDYNAFTVYRLERGRLRDVTQQVLPMPPDTDHFLYELPRFGTTIRVFRFDLNRASRRHVFDLQWRAGCFVKVRHRALFAF